MKNSTTEYTPHAPHILSTGQGTWEPETLPPSKRENRVSTTSFPAADTSTTLAPTRPHTIPSFGSFISHNQPSSMFAVFSKGQDTHSNQVAFSPVSSPAKKDTAKAAPTSESVSPRKAGAQIDPVDGKTKMCDRAKTFETFVDGGRLTADLGVTEAVGSSSDVRRGLGKLREWFGRRKR
ncbi:hypothetical protein PMIN06_008401 [Paraphaeosphaeria minitans]|uniref:Uncharacterized protein n=1 Tax=Paraphaeosphaeria minitans TaxID=565426 RepID=A0A9P6GL93_9PLEO|nr:hypothetical protein PMIN01_03105 [Paraphaeosphaeria minitans]